MKKTILSLVVSAFALSATAQKYITRSGQITFFSSTPIENIEAVNNEVAAALNLATGDVVFQVPIKSFKFEKQLMQDHFNEDYMESDKYPKAVFKGKINPSDMSMKEGNYKTTVAGMLTIHNVSQTVKLPGTITIKGNEITVNTVFSVLTADYKINIPSMAKGKIAEKINVTVNAILKKS